MWVAGTWVPERHGYRYENSRWDRDGDGVANRYDRYPDNPRRN